MISFIYFCSQVYNQKINIGILKQKQLVYSKKRKHTQKHSHSQRNIRHSLLRGGGGIISYCPANI